MVVGVVLVGESNFVQRFVIIKGITRFDELLVSVGVVTGFCLKGVENVDKVGIRCLLAGYCLEVP